MSHPIPGHDYGENEYENERSSKKERMEYKHSLSPKSKALKKKIETHKNSISTITHRGKRYGPGSNFKLDIK